MASRNGDCLYVLDFRPIAPANGVLETVSYSVSEALFDVCGDEVVLLE